MYKSLRQFTTPILIIGGLLLVLYGTNASKLQWLGLDWNYFFSNLGLYVAVVVALQWYYDQHTKRDLLMEVTEATISNVNVARSGIDDFVEMTRNIRYEQMLLNSEVVVIGFHHNPRIIDQYIKELEERVRTEKKQLFCSRTLMDVPLDIFPNLKSKVITLNPIFEKFSQNYQP